jgi:hypothetical protein
MRISMMFRYPRAHCHVSQLKIAAEQQHPA